MQRLDGAALTLGSVLLLGRTLQRRLDAGGFAGPAEVARPAKSSTPSAAGAAALGGLSLVAGIAVLRSLKDSFSPDEYFAELQKLLLEMAMIEGQLSEGGMP